MLNPKKSVVLHQTFNHTISDGECWTREQTDFKLNPSRIWWKDYCCQCFFSREPISSISQTYRKQKTFYVIKKGFQQNGPFGRKCKKDLSKLFTKIVKARPSKLLVPDFWLWATQWRGESEFKFILHIWSLLVSKSLELSFIKMG